MVECNGGGRKKQMKKIFDKKKTTIEICESVTAKLQYLIFILSHSFIFCETETRIMIIKFGFERKRNFVLTNDWARKFLSHLYFM